MNKQKNIPMGISIFLILFLLFEIYYFFFDFLFTGLFTFHGYVLNSLEYIPYLVIIVFLYVVIIFSLYKITSGFVLREKWARKFTIVYSVWASIWPIWALIIGDRVYENIIFLVLYIIVIVYLFTSNVKKYFEKSKIYMHGPYTLYTRQVDLKNSGKLVDIYFFCTHTPKSGTPCLMPEGYMVCVNPNTKMPYLKKTVKKTGDKTKEQDVKTRTIAQKTVNVIYVVSKTKPGKTKPDWAVRSHGKIFSTHRTQQTAIKAARILAKKHNATVMIQSKTGTFREGFKPKK